MKIVMVDQDGVLLDGRYKVTVDVRSFFPSLPEDIKIVPNSDTPVERIADSFKILAGLQTDIIVGEKGAVVACGGKTHFIGNVLGIDNYLCSLKKAFSNLDCDIVIGDSATWIREEKRFNPNRRMIIIDGLRLQTVGFYARTTNNYGVARLDNKWFSVAVAIVKKIPLPAGLEAKAFNAEYGIIIMNAIGVSKTDGYNFLSKKYPQATFYMIGDGDADVISDPKVIHCAVSNASANFKRNARFISDGEITVGLVDCLRWIIKQ